MNYLDSLNDIQRQAVTQTEGPVLIVAGPGSGKTRVLTYRIAHLIQSGVAPWEILSLTFTNKAAKEMKARIASVVGSKANKVWAGTFHSIFARILRVEAEKIGYTSNFTIYDTEDSKSVISSIVKQMNLDRKQYNPNAIRSRISSAKSQLITPVAYSQMEDLISADRMAHRPRVHEIYARYVKKCQLAGAMDFDDLLFQLFKLFYKNPDNVLEKYQSRFRYLMVDEFQDTNHLQYAIIKKLVDYRDENGEKRTDVPRNIAVVGDDAQSIYAFRGATIENILDFEKDFKPYGIKVFKLEQNYRSTNHIVAAANEVITFNKNQIPKKIWSDKGEGRKIQVIKTLTDGEEGRRVADTIVEFKTRYHLSNNEIAILYRTNSQSRVFEEYLRRQNINYRVYGGLSFYQRKEVKDMVAYLRLTINPKDEEALRRVINYPKKGIGTSTLDKIAKVAAENGISMWHAIPKTALSARASKAVGTFVKLIKSFQAKRDSMNAFDLASLIGRRSGLIDLLKVDHSPEGMGRLENLQALLDGIKEFVESDEQIGDEIAEDKSLASYLQTIALHTDLDDDGDEVEHVTLMSVHSAKGLEFKAIFVTGMEEDLFPSFMAKDDPNGMDEERRLFYVAITRAEQYLVLTHTASRYRFGQMRFNSPSRFLEEIHIDHIENTSQIRPRSAMGNMTSAPMTSGVKGNFTAPAVARAPALMADPSTFKPAPSSQIEQGMKVLHLKFGKGKVIKIDGSNDNRVATVRFSQLNNTEKRLVLKFAKLQIL